MDILDEFIMEMNEIKKQVEFIENSLLIDFHIPFIKRKLCSIDVISIEEIFDNRDKVFELFTNSIEETNQYLKNKVMKEIDEYYCSLVNSNEFIEIKNKILSLIGNNKTDDEIISELESDFATLCMMYGSLELPIDYLRLESEKSYQYYIISILHDVYNNLDILKKQNELTALKHFYQILTWMDVYNLHNIYRQSFIQVMSVFDASYFSMFEQLFISHFAEVVGYFKDDAINYSEVSTFNDILEIKNHIVNQQLKKCYLKELLSISKNYNDDIFYFDSKKHYGECMELINRRNSHIHNYGKVDKNYLMITKENPSGQFNIFGKNEGEYLYVDNKYLNDCIYICEMILSNLNRLV